MPGAASLCLLTLSDSLWESTAIKIASINMNPSAMDQSRLRTRASTLLARDAQLVEPYLHALAVSRYPAAPQKLLEAMDYSLMAGGKRLRPALVLECCRACSGGDRRVGDGAEASDEQPPPRSALAAAGALELIHT